MDKVILTAGERHAVGFLTCMWLAGYLANGAEWSDEGDVALYVPHEALKPLSLMIKDEWERQTEGEDLWPLFTRLRTAAWRSSINI